MSESSLSLSAMDRRAAEVAKQNKKPMKFNGVSQKLQAAYHRAIRMQTAFRRIQAQKQLEQLRQQRQHEQVCAVVIQKIVRGRVQWNRY
ncbi:hypothetical protein PsorP6_001699 [Peronosclerospora sorghi]|uniref:Uncharacterized protein n=1 Tax=Peronosclerospora sorghi TaxID=230839 RepID=A0ACC0WQ86_9STRA|nr:hypothetical protein PsorP6_001699 [Peronosclerospora sorghi]